MGNLGGGGTTLLSVTNVKYKYYSHRHYEMLQASTMDKGVVADMNLDCFVESSGISKTISSVLQPAVGYIWYDLIIGYHTTEKTILVSHVSNQLGSVIYVDILGRATSKARFADLLGAAPK